MTLNSISYTNYKGLTTGCISFDNHLTVIVGKNGAGKSSVLTAVTTAVSWIIARLRAEKGQGMYIAETDITNGSLHSCVVAAFDGIGNIRIPNKQKKGIQKMYALEMDDAIKEYVGKKREEIVNTAYRTSIPVFALYGVKRAVFDIPLRILNKDVNMFDAYSDCLKGAANFRDFFMWFRNQEDIENEYRNRKDEEAEGRYTRDLDAFRQAMRIFMPEYQDIHVRRHPLRMLVRKDGNTLNVAQLSDGEKIYLALIGDLCRRLALANPTMDNPLEGEGIVMIDELDLHLHPQWQAEIGERLVRVFPNIQFIVTTHSPHVINRTDPSCIRILKGGEYVVPDYSYGMPSEIVLKDLMELTNDQPADIERLFSDVYEAIGQGEYDRVSEAYNTLMERVPGHPGLVRVRKIIERLKITV